MAEMVREELRRQPMRRPLDNRRTRIAIIDKDSDVRELYSIELAETGYEVVDTSDVASVQELIR